MSIATTSTATLKSEGIWFDDGDLVLQTDDATFRVHSLLMIKFSSVLEGILRSALASKSIDKIDGCPAVRLQDKGGDLRTLLHALYTPRCVSFDILEYLMSCLDSLLLTARGYTPSPRLTSSRLPLYSISPPSTIATAYTPPPFTSSPDNSQVLSNAGISASTMSTSSDTSSRSPTQHGRLALGPCCLPSFCTAAYGKRPTQ